MRENPIGGRIKKQTIYKILAIFTLFSIVLQKNATNLVIYNNNFPHVPVSQLDYGLFKQSLTVLGSKLHLGSQSLLLLLLDQPLLKAHSSYGEMQGV